MIIWTGRTLAFSASGATVVSAGRVPSLQAEMCSSGWAASTPKRERTFQGPSSKRSGAAERGQAVRRRLQASQQAGWGTHAEAWSVEDGRSVRMKPPIEPTSTDRRVKADVCERAPSQVRSSVAFAGNAPSPGDVRHQSDTCSHSIRNIKLIRFRTYSDETIPASGVHPPRAEWRSNACRGIAPILSSA